MRNTFYDPVTGHKVSKKERRPDGNAVFEEHLTGERIVCRPEAMSLFPVVVRKDPNRWPIKFVHKH